MNHKYVLLTALGVVLLAGGVALGVSYGAIPVPGVVHQIIPSKNAPLVGPGATTTPQSVLDNLPEKPATPETPSKPDGKPTYGALTNTYTDAKSGFSLKYPDELYVAESGPEMALFGRDEQTFGLKWRVCTPELPCGDSIPAGSVRSLEDLKREQVSAYSGNRGLSQRTTPQENTTLTLPNSTKVLKQRYVTVIRDENGNDVTARECEMCAGEHVRYIFFTKPEEFVVFRSMPGSDPIIEEKIIRSISY